MKSCSLDFLISFFFIISLPLSLLSNNTITFNTTWQQFGVADLDYFELSADTLLGGRVYEAEYPKAATSGNFIPRGAASNKLVWGQFGDVAGEVSYNNIAGSGDFFIRIRYSRRHFIEAPQIQIYINDELQASWVPQNTDNWDSFRTTAWIPIRLRTPSGLAYYHPFQNFDDDVDRIKRFSNAFTGNFGVIGDSSFLKLSYDSEITRTGFGRPLEISYNIKSGYAVYAESFKWEWFDNESPFDLTNLFPDFLGSGFENRQIDSIVFHCRLDAEQPLTLKIELSDVDSLKGEYTIELVNFYEWERVAIAIGDFETPIGQAPFDPSEAKFLGFTFADVVGGQVVNSNETGKFYLDDIYLVENEFEKPQFQNNDDLLAYLNKVRFKFFWEAIDPTSLFIFDRHLWKDLVSVDGIGWQLASYTIAHKNSWIAPQLIEERTEMILSNLLYKCEHTNVVDSAQAYPLRYASVKGNWAHFLNSGTLERKNTNTEYSLFTNALLLSGIIVARQYFNNNSGIVAKADSLIAMTDWTFLYDAMENLMYFHWTPEDGVSRFKTDWFSEELDLAFLLGISSPISQHRLPVNPYFSNGYRRPLSQDTLDNFVFSAPGTGFTYWFLQMYASFDENTQRYENTRYAIQKDFAADQNSFGNFVRRYDQRIGGISACEGPDSSGVHIKEGDTMVISNYHPYGYCSKFDVNNDPNGTVSIYGGISTILFTPSKAIDLTKYYYTELDSVFSTEFGYSFWSPLFGLPDAFHLDPDHAFDTLINSLGFKGPWVSVPRFAIDIGPMIINTNSYLAEKGYYAGQSIRNHFSSYPALAENLSYFKTIQVHNMPEIVEIQIDSVESTTQEAVFYATIKNRGHFSYEYEWLINGIVVRERARDSTFSLSLSSMAKGDILTCNLFVPLPKCSVALQTSSDPIDLNLVSTVDKIKYLTGFEVFPNPALEHLNVNIDFDQIQKAILQLTTLSGEELYKQEFRSKNFSKILNLTSYPNGLYLISLEVDGAIKTLKIIKTGI